MKAVEMAQKVKGLSSDSQHLCPKLGISVHICNSNIMGGLRQEDCWGRLASQPKFRKKNGEFDSVWDLISRE